MLGVGIIGLGMIADTHAVAISESSKCKLIGVYDSLETKAKDFAKKYGCKAFSSLDAFLSSPEIDIVTIATPSGMHLEPALKAIDNKKNLLIEKPIEITYERASEIIKRAKEQSVLVAGVFQSRFLDSSLAVKKAVEEGRLGRIVLADAYVKWYRSQEYYDLGAWRGTWDIDGGGALMNQSIHAVDLLAWLIGKVRKVSAFTATLAHERIEVEDTATSVIQFDNGAIGVIEGTTGAWPGSPKRIEIRGTEGSIILEEDAIIQWEFASPREEDELIRKKFSTQPSAGGSSDPRAISYIGHLREYEDLADAISEGREPLVSAEEAAEAVRIIEGIYQSAKAGKPVVL